LGLVPQIKPPAPLPGRALFILPHFKPEMPHLVFQVHMIVIGRLKPWLAGHVGAIGWLAASKTV